MTTTSRASRGYTAVLLDREVLGLLASRLVSLAGDQVARVALTVLVFQSTRSGALAAAAYACTYLPAIVAGPLLGGLVDRRPRRTVLVVVDLMRAALFLLMAVPALPLGPLLLLVLVATALDAPFGAARSALLRDITDDTAAYSRGTSLDEALDSSGQIVGFAAAGLLLVVVSPTTALLLNAASFVLSALLLRGLVRHRPAAVTAVVERGRRWRDSARVALVDGRQGWSAAMAPACRRPVLLTWAGLFAVITPEALAAPWADRLGAGPVGVGLLFAAAPVGTILGVLLVGRVAPVVAQRWLVPLTVLGVAPLLLCALEPPLPLALLLVATSGLGASFSLVARVMFVENVDHGLRGRAFSVAATGVMVTQGLGILAAGTMTLVLPAPLAVAACGAAGLVLIAGALLLSRRPERDEIIWLPDGPALPIPAPRASREQVAQPVAFS